MNNKSHYKAQDLETEKDESPHRSQQELANLPWEHERVFSTPGHNAECSRTKVNTALLLFFPWVSFLLKLGKFV